MCARPELSTFCTATGRAPCLRLFDGPSFAPTGASSARPIGSSPANDACLSISTLTAREQCQTRAPSVRNPPNPKSSSSSSSSDRLLTGSSFSMAALAPRARARPFNSTSPEKIMRASRNRSMPDGDSSRARLADPPNWPPSESTIRHRSRDGVNSLTQARVRARLSPQRLLRSLPNCAARAKGGKKVADPANRCSGGDKGRCRARNEFLGRISKATRARDECAANARCPSPRRTDVEKDVRLAVDFAYSFATENELVWNIRKLESAIRMIRCGRIQGFTTRVARCPLAYAFVVSTHLRTCFFDSSSCFY
ncbi:hypothetical protein MPTK1_1g27790 [Marchantia polymorpha subsp. ruderalis]|uniref:Uncharacterized protein n=2 Tax=Marchantia polymorpha TaxID=3197 RepID=A0AAF6AUZ4_MARPO|nr:hypothetical protein MARPO_0002s0099 [Marchantia polymorpha]BBN00265.1 hypothetical protein Mp_1g27790 [Marchantia polymorpha subsp. ruderalis]|eukprot:PTQ49618.1 hypothetical protein MARPO_0002s0099 [Marchantia polymorpha]